jgi:DNA repair protein RecO (recombination protein O)
MIQPRCGNWAMAEDTLVASPAPAARPRRHGPESRVDHQPGFVLHTTPWRETSLIVEAISRDYGRVALVARGAKRPTSQFRGLLAPFAPLALSWSGRNEVKSLVRVEWVGGLTPLRGNALLAAFYANELLVRLLARADPHERLFAHYLQLLRGLADTRHDVTLRTFELELLREIGYAVALDQCASGQPIDAGARYRFAPESGPQRIHGPLPDDGVPAVAGSTLLAMARGDFTDARVAAESKALLRQLIRYHLGGKPLNTRRILLDLHQL